MQMEYIALKDVCKINMGQSPDSSSYNDNEDGIPFFQGNADFGERYPVTRVWCNAPTKIAQPEDILISVRAPIGALNFAIEECCIGRGLAALTPDRSKVSLEFIYWLLKGKNAELNSKGTGSTFKAISRKVLEDTRVPAIDLGKQHEYAKILEKTYSVIQNRREELSALDNLIKARFVELFGNCKEKCKLSEYAELITKGASPRWQGVEYSDNEEGTLFVTSENVREGFIDYSKRKYLPNEINDILPRSVLKRNDVLINIVNASIGRAAIYESDDLANINQAVALVRLKPDSLNLKFLLAFLNSDEAIRAYDYMKVGGDKANLSLKNISDLQIPVADMSVQNQFADFTKQVDKSKFAVQKALEQEQLLFDSLMQKYFG